MTTRLALAAALGIATVSALPGSSHADIIVTGERITEQFDLFLYRSLVNGWDYDISYMSSGPFSFDGGGGGVGDFSLELPPDCSVDVCLDDPDVDPDENTVIIVEGKLVDAVNGLTDSQFTSLIPYLYTATYELDYQLKLGMLGYDADFSYYESLMLNLYVMTVQYGYANGTIAPIPQ